MTRPAVSRRCLVLGVGATGILPHLAVASPRRSAGFSDRVAGALYGLAIGDGMGAPVEGWTPARIKAQFPAHDFNRFLPATAPPASNGPGKGDGRITDDTLLIEALMRAYQAHGDHLDAYAYARLIAPELGERKVFVPERGDERTLLERPIWWPERFVYHRLAINNAPPREGGFGNWPNQGLAGIIMPTGTVNAGDPDGAYHETALYGAAHQVGQGLESAAVSAAGFAEAFGVGATIESVIEVSVRLAQDGTRPACDACTKAANPIDDLDTFIGKVRRAYLPWSGLIPGETESVEADPTNRQKSNFAQPSRTTAVENLPVALACLRYGQGDALKTLSAAVYYGQDCESIAAHALGLVGALYGLDTLPVGLRQASDSVNRRDFTAVGRAFAGTAATILAKDSQRKSRRRASIQQR